MNQEAKIDPLGEYLRVKWHDERPVLSHYHTTKAYEIALCKFILQALSEWRGKNEETVMIGYDFDCEKCSLPNCLADKAIRVRCVRPLIGKEGE
jgi:hypothetical protein